MKMKSLLSAMLIVGIAAFQTGCNAEQTEKAPAEKQAETKKVEPAKTEDSKKVESSEKEKISYAIGMNIGNNIKRQAIDVDVDTMAKAINDVVSGKPLRFTEQEAQQAMMAMQTQLQAKREEENKKAAAKNKSEGEDFLAENAKKPDVKTTASGLQYKVITEGSGESPKTTNTVTAHYRGRLINGTEFDSSYKRGQPMDFPVTGVIPGWTEALQLMKPGAKWELYIPSNLAYGERGSRNIGPNSTLIFEIELVAVKSSPAPANETSQAVSGEIIKVPSKAELDKGAKIEVIRPGQTNELKPKQ
jgi:FKBP-type peptidyl-prolyl cis-trans isomerase